MYPPPSAFPAQFGERQVGADELKELLVLLAALPRVDVRRASVQVEGVRDTPHRRVQLRAAVAGVDVDRAAVVFAQGVEHTIYQALHVADKFLGQAVVNRPCVGHLAAHHLAHSEVFSHIFYLSIPY